MLKNFVIIVSIILVGSVVAGIFVLWQFNSPIRLIPEDGKTWVNIKPIQCLSNAWERDWVKSHSDNILYPRKDVDAVDDIIRDYYQRQGIALFEIKRDSIRDENGKPQTTVCLACSCSAGYVLYFLVADSDVELMTGLGFTAF